MLYGLSFLYGMTGTTSLPAIQAFLAGGVPEANRFAIYAITLLVLAGFGFKIAAVPFHFWCPDVYQGAATPVTALLSVLPKAAGLAIVLRFFYGAFSAPGTAPWDLAGSIDWAQLVMLISVLTMTLGNVAALTQTNMKRLLAYSSIAHAGYLLMGIVALSENGARGLLVYLAAYLFMNLGAFLVVTLVHLHEDSFDLRDYPGLYRRAPLLTVAMAFFLLSLVGIPPFIGFLGKLYVFAAVIEKGMGVYATIAAVNAADRGLLLLPRPQGHDDRRRQRGQAGASASPSPTRPGSWPSPWPTSSRSSSGAGSTAGPAAPSCCTPAASHPVRGPGRTAVIRGAPDPAGRRGIRRQPAPHT